MRMLRTLVWRTVTLAALWIVLFPSPGLAWAVGAVVVAIAVWRSLVLLGPQFAGPRPRWLVLPPLFIWESAASALQVAFLAVSPKKRFTPTVIRYRPRSSSPRVTMALSWVISAMPGTLVGSIGDGEMTVHVLDSSQPVHRNIARTERRLVWAMGDGGEGS